MQIKTNTARVGIKHQSVKLNQIKTFPNKQVCMSGIFYDDSTSVLVCRQHCTMAYVMYQMYRKFIILQSQSEF